jgi:PAS domain S-box-containing protein
MMHSLRWRLPIAMAILVVIAPATFLAIAYREVQTSARQAAAARAQAAAGELAATVAQNAQTRYNELRRIAAGAAARRLVEDPSDEARAAVKASFPPTAANAPQLVEIWSRSGERLLSWTTPPTAADILPPGTPPASPGIGLLRRDGNRILSESVADIPSDPVITTSSVPRLGFVVVRRPIAAAPTGDLLNRLIGQNGSVAIGNTSGDVWTNLTAFVPPPPAGVTLPGGGGEYTAADGQRHIGAVAAIRGTPFSVWVDFPSSVVLAPARTFLRRMVLVAVVFITISAGVIVLLTRGITTPLHELTQATEAIAAGEYSRRVHMPRRDEIGRLAASINTMSEQVAGSHRELEARVRERTAELDRFFSLSPDLLCIADVAEGRFVRVNPAWQAVLGWSDQELTARPYIELVHPDDVAPTAEQVRAFEGGSSTVNFENRYRHKDGSYRWLSWKAAAFLQRGLVYAAARDVTEAKRSARDLQQRADELAAVNHELEAFSYSVSHDLRAPLRHITGFAMLLEESASGRLDDEGRRFLKTIVSAATRMGQLIDDLLSFSRVGRVQLARHRVDLNDLVRDAQKEVAADVNGRQVEWRFHHLPIVDGDRAMLRLVFINLLSNALKYSSTRPRAEIEVGSTSGGSGHEAVIFVRDNGVGFDMQYAHKLFGVFQRLHRADEFQGTGIGLANVRRIVQRHGGRTWADGRLDAGATFYFSLPLERTRTL